MSTDVLEVARLGSRASESLFELTAPPGALPSAADFLIAEMERRFGGRVVRAEKPEEIAIEPEQYAPRAIFEPEWERYRDESGKLPFRVEVARLLWQSDNAKLRKKALRFLNCNKCGRSGLCSRYPEEHKFYIPNGCEVVFCKQCADEMRRALTFEYVRVILASIERLGGIPDGWVLARVSFTLRSDGSEITPERVKKFNACVRKVMRRVIGARKNFGMLFVDEVGFETRGHLPDSRRVSHGLNLHLHGLYFGPALPNRSTCARCESTVKKVADSLWNCRECGEISEVHPGRVTRLYMEESLRAFGVESRGFFVNAVKGFAENPERAVRWALNHMLKYVSKPPGVTPERLASLIMAFHTARRVHALGLFYGKKPKHEKHDCPCPKCKADGIISVVGFEGRALPNGGFIPSLEPIESLEARGFVSLRGAGRDFVLSRGVSREESWGQSP